jgi:zinc protease
MGRVISASQKAGVWAAPCLALASSLALIAVPPALAQEAAPLEPSVPAAAAPASGVAEWGIASADFPADPDVTFGVLPNGMRYALKRHNSPAGQAAIRFTIAAGGRDEADAENGAAHFVEHMAFNGSANIPEGALIPMLERLGLAFGADTNAETSLDYTTYKLDLPRTSAETVDFALKVIREMAGELLIAPDAVERERGIILSEAQVRNDPGRRRAADYLQTAVPGARLGERVRADIERIQNISAEELRAFYEGHYRPEKATLVMVGDFDVAEIRSKIEAVFSDWQGQGEPRPAYKAPPLPETARLASFVDPSIPEIIDLQRVSLWEPPANTAIAARDDLLRAIAAAALSNRVNALTRLADAPILGAQAGDQPLARTARLFGLFVVAKDGQWSESLALAERELRRAHQYGFTAAEIAEAKANIQTALTNAVAQAPGRQSAAIAQGLIAASLEDSVPTAPAFDLAFYQAIEASLTPAAVSDAFRAAWQGSPSVVHVSTKQAIAGGEQAIAARLVESAAVAVTAPAEVADVQFAYTQWDAPGEVVSDSLIEDLGIRTLRFANGLQFNLKVTDFEPGKVAFSMRVGDGLASFPQDRPGLREMVGIIASLDGLEAHDTDELRRVLAGRAVSLPLSASDGALVAAGTTSPADLRLQLDLLAARLMATGWRPETEAQWAGIAPVLVQNIRANPVQIFSAAVSAVVAGDDARMGLVDPGALNAATMADLRAVAAPQLATGPLALGLVGDFDADAAIAAVAATLGALPAREARSEAVPGAAPVAFVADRRARRLTHVGEPDQGVLAIVWPGSDGNDQRDAMARDLLASVMGLRLIEKLREELGATYSPTAFSYSQRTYPGFGHITAFATVSAEAMDDTASAIRAIADELASAPVTADLLDRARNPIRESFQRAESGNSGWIEVVTMAQSDPAVLTRRRARREILDTLTPADLQAAARRYLEDETPLEIRVVPQG